MSTGHTQEQSLGTTSQDTGPGRDHSNWLWWFLVVAIPLVLCAAVYTVYPQAIAPSHLSACAGSYHGPGPTSDLNRLSLPVHGYQQVGTYRWAGVIAMPIWADSTCTDVYLQLNGHSAAHYFNDAQG